MNDALAYVPDASLALRYRQLTRRIQQLPPRGSRPLTISGRVAGWVSPKATRYLDGLPGILIDPEAVHITSAPRQRMPLNAVLAHLAESLKDTGCLRGWRNELLDVYGEGRRLGAIERAAVRPLGLLTKAVHLSAWAPDGRMWVARRASSKNTDPDMWDTLVGGLACTNENIDTSLLRESNEEAGLCEADLACRDPLRIILRMHRRLPEGYQVEDVLVSDCVLPESVQPRNMDGEVSEIQLLPVKDIWAMIEAGEFTREAELVILDSLRRKMQQGTAAS